MIKIIIEHYVTKIDACGNRYWKSRIINCHTGKVLTIYTPHSSNTEHTARAVYEWDEMYIVIINEMEKADFYQIKVDANCRKEDQIIEAIKSLSRKDQPTTTKGLNYEISRSTR